MLASGRIVGAWMLVAIWAVAIYLTIPFARAVQRYVAASSLGSDAFLWLVLVLVSIGGVLALRSIVRKWTSWTQFLWLAVVTSVFVWSTLELRSSPEEAVHFVQYGVLGLLIFRALAHSIRDPTIYGTAVAIGASIGIVDEVIQWLTPERFWGLRDIWFNFVGVALTMVGIALGTRPSSIRGPITPRGIRWFCRAAAVALLLLGANLLNTPERFRFDFIEAQNDQMVEYGHLHSDPEIAVFRSRFSLEELARTDRERAGEAAAILDRYATAESYNDFLATYPGPVDPFLHEMRVRIFRRDRYARVADEHGAEEASREAGVAVRENQILEKYFPETLARSKLKWPGEKVAAFLARAEIEDPYESPVSSELFTRFSEVQLVSALIAALLALFLGHRRADRWARSGRAGSARGTRGWAGGNTQG
jgi:VanZ family protein